jgi:hypothetical protein
MMTCPTAKVSNCGTIPVQYRVRIDRAKGRPLVAVIVATSLRDSDSKGSGEVKVIADQAKGMPRVLAASHHRAGETACG